MKDHIVIVRTGANVIDFNSYNCQELGLAKALARRGYKVSLIMAGYATSHDSVSVDGSTVDVFLLKVRSIDIRLGFFTGIDSLLKKIEPTILQVHDMGIYMSWWVTKWAVKHEVPCYLIQGVYQTSSKPIVGLIDNFITSFFGKKVLKTVKGVGCKSYMASDYVKKYHNRETSLVKIGLDDSKFQTTHNKNWRTELGIESKKVLLYVGKMEERRQPLLLLSIIENLPEDYVLILVGEGPQFELTKSEIERRELVNRVFMLGMVNQNELPSVYESSDLFLLASSYEIYGMVIMESMYFGAPVVSSHSGGAEIIIDNQKDGVIVDDFNTNSWVKEIKSICENEYKLNAMKDQAQKKIRDKFLWDKSVDTFVDLYGKA